MNKNYALSLDEWCACFNFPKNNDNYLRASFTGLDPSLEQYYNRMSFTSRVSKGKNIQHPTICYLFYVIDNTLLARNEFMRLNEEDILVLAKVAFNNIDLSLNLGAILVRYLEYQSSQSQGPITGGCIITVLSIAIGISLGELQPVLGERHVGFCRGGVTADAMDRLKVGTNMR